MIQTVKHVQLHRIEQTELRVVSDVDTGVLPVIECEETVIRGYIQSRHWPHRLVSLFILQNLEPLVRQLNIQSALLPSEAAMLGQRPAVNIYDQSDAQSCHVFINQQRMVQEGYWDDQEAVQGLLAHEHAHPIAENATIRAARSLRVEVELVRRRPVIQRAMALNSQRGTERMEKMQQSLTALAETLCVYAPREIFANEMTIVCGFGAALLHLDRRNMENARRSVAGRDQFRQQVEHEVHQFRLAAAEVDQLLLMADLSSYLELSLEIAPFYRTGHIREAHELEAVLESSVFPHVAPDVAHVYAGLRERYCALQADMPSTALLTWSQELLDLLAQPLKQVGLDPVFRPRIDTPDE